MLRWLSYLIYPVLRLLENAGNRWNCIQRRRKLEKFTYGNLARGRKTVVDLLTMIAPAAVPCYLIRDINMSWANQVKSDLQERGVKITVTAILLKAIAIAQKLHPASRSDILPFGRMVTYEDIVGGFTIERDENGSDTVYFGEIESPDQKSLSEIAQELVSYAQSNTSELAPLALQKLYTGLPYLIRRFILAIACVFPSMRIKCQKATFGLTTLGKYNVKSVLSPCICTSTFGIGTVEDRAMAVDGRICVMPTMTVSFNFNTRAMDAEAASAFFEDVCRLMEGRLADYIESDFENAPHPLAPVRRLQEAHSV